MKKTITLIVCSTILTGCNLTPGTTVVYYPTAKKTVTVVEEEITYVEEPEVVVIEEYTYPVCDPFYEEYSSPFYHYPEFCTDYGLGVGYCCTWEFSDGIANCSSEHCFWDDSCEWDHMYTECVEEYYEYY